MIDKEVLCGDYPAPCNCDDPDTHDGAVEAAIEDNSAANWRSALENNEGYYDESELMADQPTGLVILFDDERSFVPGFRDDAVVIRTKFEAETYFTELMEKGEPIAELWLDFVLSPGSVDEVLGFFPGELAERVIYHSSAYGGYGLIESILRNGGFQGELEWPTDIFSGQQIFLAK